MKNKKKILFAVLIIILLVVVLLLIVMNNNDNKKILNEKIEEIKQTLIENEEIDNTKEQFIVLLSVSDSQEKAYVRTGKGNTLDKAIKRAKREIEKIISSKDIEPKWVKIDIIDSEEKISEEEISSLIDEQKYFFQYGISFDDDYEIVLLDAELNFNNIINYNSNSINLTSLNEYINKDNKGIDISIDSYSEVIIFDCISYIYDEEDVYKIINDEQTYSRRDDSDLTKERIAEIIADAGEYLANNVKEDGSFIYQYNIMSGEESSGYNILRHEGTTWSMIQSYSLSPSDELKSKIDLAINYVIENAVRYKDENTAFIKEIDSTELKLGANGIAVLMLAEYIDVFGSEEYYELAIKIGNAILEMQNDDGSYYHVYKYPRFEELNSYRTVYYDGEATYALVRLYELTGDEKWLEAAEKSMDYFVENNYEKYSDHWIEYAVNTIVDYIPKQEYFRLAIITLRYKAGTLNKTEYQGTIMELLVNRFRDL